MPEYKTPGVYIEEISTLPASIAGVATAIPAFVGYTEKAEALNSPVRILSMLEYEENFGKAFDERFAVRLQNPVIPGDDPIVTVSVDALSFYLLYYQVRMHFDNGGGPCWIVSVGAYVDTAPVVANIDAALLITGLATLEKEDEPTILVVPEAIHLGDPGIRRSVYDAMLTQAAKLQDRVAVMDVVEAGGTVQQDADNFRNDDVGPDNLKYGACYYPLLKTTMSKYYTENSVLITDDRTISEYTNCTLNVLRDGSDKYVGKIVITDNASIALDEFTINGVTFTEGTQFNAGGTATQTAIALETAINTNGDAAYTVSRKANVIFITSVTSSNTDPNIGLVYADSGSGIAASVFPVVGGQLAKVKPFTDAYNRAVELISAYRVDLYPSGTMVGIYARVDRERGVWKAPANVGVRIVKEPNILVTNEEQENLNVDATSGKSINVIRTFAGKGTIVWGARTLAGNDNEWRYVSVRRFYNYVEESIKKATEFVVFEPNDRKTWVRVKGMIENFLQKQWSDGALAGAKPEDAFFVKVGLGETMTSLDILEGRLIVEIGMAAVRPAEFIILKFSHKLQES